MLVTLYNSMSIVNRSATYCYGKCTVLTSGVYCLNPANGSRLPILCISRAYPRPWPSGGGGGLGGLLNATPHRHWTKAKNPPTGYRGIPFPLTYNWILICHDDCLYIFLEDTVRRRRCGASHVQKGVSLFTIIHSEAVEFPVATTWSNIAAPPYSVEAFI